MQLSSILIAVTLLCGDVLLIAQEEGESSSGSHDITVDRSEGGWGITVTDHRTDASSNGHNGADHDRSVAGTNSARPVDPYPALTAANNAYNQAVAAWQQATKAYQQALEEQKAIRDKYVDAATNTVRPGFDYYTALTVVNAADKKVQDAWFELDQKEKARNEASSRAAAEFKRAMEQYYGNGGGGATGTQGGSPGSSSQGPMQRTEGHCAKC